MRQDLPKTLDANSPKFPPIRLIEYQGGIFTLYRDAVKGPAKLTEICKLANNQVFPVVSLLSGQLPYGDVALTDFASYPEDVRNAIINLGNEPKKLLSFLEGYKLYLKSDYNLLRLISGVYFMFAQNIPINTNKLRTLSDNLVLQLEHRIRNFLVFSRA